MSQEAVIQVITKAVIDADFRKQLLTQPTAALFDYDLTEAERITMSKMKPEAFDNLESNLEERVSKVSLAMGFSYLAGHSSSFGTQINPQPEPPGIQDLLNFKK